MRAADGLDRVRHHRRVPGSVGQEHAVRLPGQDVGRGRAGRHHLDCPEPGELAQDGPLDAEVVGHDPERAAADDGVRPVRRHLVHEVDPDRPRLAAGHGPQDGFGSVTERTGHRAAVTEQAGEPPGVDAGDAGDAVAPEQAVEVTVGPPVGAAPGQLPDHHAAAERAAGLEVCPVHAVVADVGVREGDDLAGVARVGQDLLVARQDRVEDHLARGDTAGRFGSDQLALEDRSVGQDERALPRCDPRRAHRAPPRVSRGVPCRPAVLDAARTGAACMVMHRID